MQELLSMGGYAAYVWPAYIVTFVLLIGLLLVSLRDWHRSERRLALLREASGRRGRAAGHDAA